MGATQSMRSSDLHKAISAAKSRVTGVQVDRLRVAYGRGPLADRTGQLFTAYSGDTPGGTR